MEHILDDYSIKLTAFWDYDYRSVLRMLEGLSGETLGKLRGMEINVTDKPLFPHPVTGEPKAGLVRYHEGEPYIVILGSKPTLEIFRHEVAHAIGIKDEKQAGRWGQRTEMGPTPGQIRYIAQLSMRLGKPEPDVRSYAEAGRMIRELEAEDKYRKRVRSNALALACHNALATHGISVHYTVLTLMVQGQHPELKTTDSKVLAILNWRKDIFRKVDTGVYFLASKSEGRAYPEL